MNTTETLKTFNDMTTKSVERASSFSELGMRAFEKMAALQMGTMNLYMDHSMQMMKLATEAKGYNDFVKGQFDATKNLGERLMEDSKTSMQAMNEVRDDYRVWFEKNLSEVTSELRQSVPSV